MAHHGERVVEILRDELAEYGVRLPELRLEREAEERPTLHVGAVPLASAFAFLRLLTDYRRLLVNARHFGSSSKRA